MEKAIIIFNSIKLGKLKKSDLEYCMLKMQEALDIDRCIILKELITIGHYDDNCTYDYDKVLEAKKLLSEVKAEFENLGDSFKDLTDEDIKRDEENFSDIKNELEDILKELKSWRDKTKKSQIIIPPFVTEKAKVLFLSYLTKEELKSIY